ncbi:MAG: hypothetical protein PHD13_07065 [Methanocellales archaeon]|nr:hypothetical protein [Methanocellales archaeon]MDD3291530.1 hypothetical protein [Methanocellales archaeon]MDD5235920.1 hypothetical protein [Methanocellales archaeon]MDD5485312.1 hypothetical protein [Methanocellales archaeon]
MKKINLEIVDGDMKTTVTFEGDLGKKRVLQLIEALDFQPTSTETSSRTPPDSLDLKIADEKLTVKERLRFFLRYEYPKIWFTSIEVREHYGRVFGKIPLSTVSTYLARMYREGILERRGNRVQREYRFIHEGPTDQTVAQNMALHL